MRCWERTPTVGVLQHEPFFFWLVGLILSRVSVLLLVMAPATWELYEVNC